MQLYCFCVLQNTPNLHCSLCVLFAQELVVHELRTKVADVEKSLLETKDSLRISSQDAVSLRKKVDEDQKKFDESLNVIANNKEVRVINSCTCSFQ